METPGVVTSLSADELSQLAATVRRGTPWREALYRLTQPSARPERTEHRTDDARGNWLWLVSLARWERALDVQGGIGTTAAALSRHFASVQYIDWAGPLVEFARARFTEDRSLHITCARAGANALPYGDATFDCVAWDGALGRPVTDVATADPPAVLPTVLAECRRVLRPGGCLYLGIATSPVQRRIVRRLERLTQARAMRRQLRAAGFARVHAYYLHPSFQQPWSIVPARRRAVVAYERLQLASARRRRWLAWVGLHAVLFDCHVFIAYA